MRNLYRLAVMACVTTCAGATSAAADDTPGQSEEIVVTARKLDAARDAILPSLGASEYNFARSAIDAQPGGQDRGISKLLQQAPGVTQDSDDEIHVRNEHGNIQYRLNGVIIPESIAGFGQTIDTRIAQSVSLLTGTLPAQYGYRTAGVVNIATQSGAFDLDGDVDFYGGSNGQLQPSITLKNSSGGFNYFVSASYLRNDLGIENPTRDRKAIHDRTDQYRGFAYVSQILSDTSRISAFGGTAIGRFQIPNNPGQVGRYQLDQRTTFDSSRLDQNQREVTHYGVASYQYSDDALNVLIAPFVRFSRTSFSPDPAGGDVIFSGYSDRSRLSSLALVVQTDASYRLSDAHTIRGGLFFQNERTRSAVTSLALPTDSQGNQTRDSTFAVTVAGSKTGRLYGVYLQDEWTLTPEVTINIGARFDAVAAYTTENQLSPRINLVYAPAKATTFHAGYARDFTPPPQELIGTTTVARFAGTTKASEIPFASPVRAEREHYFDVGVLQTVFPGLTVGLDGYYKIKRNLLDDGQFGASLVASPFNYERGYAWGVELTTSYKRGALSLYANAARGQEKGRNIVSSEFFFDDAELGYIRDHYIYTDHSQTWSASGGGSYAFADGIGKLTPSADFVYGDGLRAGDPAGAVPNGGKLPSYVQVNFGVSQSIDAVHGLTVRFDVTNAFDASYAIRDGSGVGVGAPQFSGRRAFFGGIRAAF